MANVTRTTRKRALSLVKEAVSVTTKKAEILPSTKKHIVVQNAKKKKEAPAFVKSTPWVTMTLPRTELDLSKTLKCGQSFRWHREHQELESGQFSSPTFSCVLDNRMWCIQETEDGFRYKTFRPLSSLPPTHEKEESDKMQKEYIEQDKEFLRDYFQFDVPLTELYIKWSKADANFKAKALLFPGATKLCQEYGSPITIPADFPDESPKTYYGFPTINDLAQEGVEETLRNLGFGYRAKYIAKTAKMINDMENGEEWLLGLRNLPYEEAHTSLLTLQGVGPKVADCVCLMSLDKQETIPVDTHVWQIALRDYKFRFEGKIPKTISPAIYKAVGKHFVNLFGEYSGWAHSVLFAADLRTIEGVVKEESGSIIMIKEEIIDDEATILSKIVKEEDVVKLEEQETRDAGKGLSDIKLEDSSIQPKLSTVKIAVAQFCGGQSVSSNLAACIRLMGQASKQAAKVIFFPEASDFIGNPSNEALTLSHRLNSSPFLEGMCAEAKQLGIWCSVGIHEKSPYPDKLYNTHVIINDQGSIVESYRKIHLFDVDIENGPRLMESNNTVAGDRLAAPVLSPVGKIGLGICYDLRFPELALGLRKQGADILTYPSAFTVKTGEAHWEILLRSRAIETQSYVVAAAQVGRHTEKRSSYGHAMIVDPWGKVVAECDGENEGIAVAPVELSVLERIRAEMPVMAHRRYDVFSQ
ncbi:Carbon-nitrogen hydrolase [Entomortierella beljakovae]|nr:Carbon-nitrogen hydrolase [Entomortierella beljakovae]